MYAQQLTERPDRHGGTRTPDTRCVKPLLSQLSYAPVLLSDDSSYNATYLGDCTDRAIASRSVSLPFTSEPKWTRGESNSIFLFAREAHSQIMLAAHKLFTYRQIDRQGQMLSTRLL